MEHKKIEAIARNVSKRYNKNTLCSAITNKEIISFIERNGLLPEGFLLIGPGRLYGYNSIRNRILAMPLYTYNKIVSQFNSVYQDISVEKQDNINQVSMKLSALKGIEDMIKQNMIVVFLSNFSPKTNTIDSLSKFNILIEDLDVMGTIEGRLVPKTGNEDENAGNNIDD